MEIREPNILVLSSMANNNSPEISDILNIRISENLSTAGFNSIIIEGDASVTKSIGNALFMGAFFIIEIIHVNDTDGIFSVRAYSTWDGAFIGEERALISGFNEESFLNIGSSLVPILKEKLKTEEAMDMAERITMPQSDDTDSKAVQPATEKQAAEIEDNYHTAEAVDPKETDESGISPPSETLPTAEEKLPKKNRYGLVSVENGTFISSFNTSGYVGTAFHSTVRGHRCFATPPFTVETGGLINFIPLVIKGSAAETQSYLCSLGAELGVESCFADDFYCFYRMAVGGSYLLMNTRETGILKKILPFASCGIGSGMMIDEHWNLSLAVNYSLFAEESLLINGFTPSLGINYIW